MDKNSQEIEEWRSIEGYEELYEVSSLGRVRSCDRFVKFKVGTRLHKGKLLKPFNNGCGYLHVVLYKDNKKKMFLVHRLVYASFHGKIPEGMQVNHIDEDKTNNSLENLNLMTPKQNMNWGTAIERRSKKHSKPIIQFDRQGNFITEFESLMDAGMKLSINTGMICMVLKGQMSHTHGFIFKYKTS